MESTTNTTADRVKPSRPLRLRFARRYVVLRKTVRAYVERPSSWLGSRLLHLLMPKEMAPVTCDECDSSANSPLAIFCAGCGTPLISKFDDRMQKCVAWGAAIGFVVLAALAGFVAFRFGLYAIVTVMYMSLGAAMLRRYKPNQVCFLSVSGLVFMAMYVALAVLESPLRAVSTMATWYACSLTIALVLASLTFLLIMPLGQRVSIGLGSALLLLLGVLVAATLAASWAAGTWPPWGMLALLGVAALGFTVLLLSLAFSEGFRVRIRRPGVLIEPVFPFAHPIRPQRERKQFSHLPLFYRSMLAARDHLAWSLRLSLHYLLVGLVHFANAFARWSCLILDLVLRSAIRAWRRLVELFKTIIQVFERIGRFALQTGHLLVLGILAPVITILLSAWIAVTLSNLIFGYLMSPRLLVLTVAMLWTIALLGVFVLTIALFARCHPGNVVVMEAFQSFGLCFPWLLLLLYATSVGLSLLSWATSTGPFRFGTVSVVLTISIVGLLSWIAIRAKALPSSPVNKKAQGQETFLVDAPTDADATMGSTTATRPQPEPSSGDS